MRFAGGDAVGAGNAHRDINGLVVTEPETQLQLISKSQETPSSRTVNDRSLVPHSNMPLS